jgi:hypothetical protein
MASLALTRIALDQTRLFFASEQRRVWAIVALALVHEKRKPNFI